MKIRLFKDTRLKFAIIKNDLKVVSKLLNDGCSADFKIDGKTALMYALEKGYFDVASQLINANADINKTDEDFYSPLHYAFLNENTPFKIIKSLVIHGANVNAVSSIGRTPLHMACINGNLPAMKYLISVGADLYRTDMFGNTLMHMACTNNYTDIVKFLVDNELNLYQHNNRGVRAVDLLESGKKQRLFYSIRFKDRKRMKEALGIKKKELKIPMRKESLSSLEPDFTLDNAKRNISQLLFVACKRGNVRYAKYLIDMGADVTATDLLGSNVLMTTACKNNDINMIQLLMENGVSIFERNSMLQAPVDLLSPKMRQKLSLEDDMINRILGISGFQTLLYSGSSSSVEKPPISDSKPLSYTKSSPSIAKLTKQNNNIKIPNRSVSLSNLNKQDTHTKHFEI